jgi:glutathione peroxidase
VSIYDIPVKTLNGEESKLGDLAGKTLLVVNVSSKCGLTPQYTALEELHARLAPRGFSVVGFPCNQFGGQEPGTAEEIEQFCSTTYGVTFPMFEKIEVNGAGRHPLYAELTAVPDADGQAGDIQWNFEKFVIGASGSVVARFRPRTVPTTRRCLPRSSRAWRAEAEVAPLLMQCTLRSTRLDQGTSQVTDRGCPQTLAGVGVIGGACARRRVIWKMAARRVRAAWWAGRRL